MGYTLQVMMSSQSRGVEMILAMGKKWYSVRPSFQGKLGDWERSVLRAIIQIEGKRDSLFRDPKKRADWGFASRPVIAKHLGLDFEQEKILKRISRTVIYLRKEGWIQVHKICRPNLPHGANRILVSRRALRIVRFISKGFKKVWNKIQGPYINSGTSGSTTTATVTEKIENLRILRDGLAFIIRTGGMLPPGIEQPTMKAGK